MHCKIYEKYELGEISEIELREHRSHCRSCRDLLAQDEKLMTLSAGLNRQIEAPLLWAKIENKLRDEQRQNRRSRFDAKAYFNKNKALLLRTAAMLIVAIGVASYFLSTPDLPADDIRILTASALSKIEKRERAYEKAIAELEKLVVPKFSEMDVELMLLYRDRLETIDSQIERCREALAENPANAHIRRYLLAALQDKRQTLGEVAEFDKRVVEN